MILCGANYDTLQKSRGIPSRYASKILVMNHLKISQQNLGNESSQDFANKTLIKFGEE
jgi:hypothetical protein